MNPMSELVWEKIFGHEEKIAQLKKTFAEEKFPHAVIFSGAEGIGKRKIADTCAKVLLCENPSAGSPCEVCESCQLVEAGTHPDFYVVEPETSKTSRTIKIGQVRALQRETFLRPIKSARRVAIIDGAEFMNKDAANCLLKTLEEPPSQTKFILVTANRAGLLMTLRSRCITINFERLTKILIKNFLVSRKIEPSMSEKISLIADGSIGRAIKLSESGGYELRETALVFVEKICREELTVEDIFMKGAQISDWSREQFADFVTYIQKILRDIFLCGQAELYNPDKKEQIFKIKISEEKLSAMIDVGVEVFRRLKSNANLRLLAESYLLRLKFIVENRQKGDLSAENYWREI